MRSRDSHTSLINPQKNRFQIVTAGTRAGAYRLACATPAERVEKLTHSTIADVVCDRRGGGADFAFPDAPLNRIASGHNAVTLAHLDRARG